MTEREWLLRLFEDVRVYFRYEADPNRQDKEEEAMRKTMYGYMDALQSGEFEDADELPMNLINAVSYIRHSNNEVEPLRKAIWYLNREVEKLCGNNKE